MNSTNPVNDPQRNRIHIAIIAVTTIAAILISLYYLFSGSFIVFQNLFYIPIILSCMYYTMRGFIYSACLAVLYMLLILVFASEHDIIMQALVRVVLFIAIAGIVTFLSTQRKRAEEALRESDEIYKILAESSFAAVFIVQDGKFRFINTSAIIYAGYSAEELIDQQSDMIVHPDDRKLVIQKGQEMLVGRSNQAFEFRMVTKQNEVRWISQTVAPIHYQGRPAILGNAMDITENKRAEETMWESRRQLIDIIDFLPDATLAIDKEGRVIIWNKAIEQMTGIPAAEMIGKGNHAYTIPFYGEARPQLMDLIFKDIDEVSARYPSITREGETLMAEVFCHALYDNKGAWVFAKASPLHDQGSNVIGAIESIRDITELKDAEKAMRESEERYRMIFNHSPLGVVHFDSNGVIIDFNEKFARIIGAPKEKIIGFNLLGELRDPVMLKAVKDALGGILGYYEGEYLSVTGAKPTPMRAVYQSITTEDGMFLGAVGILEDITARRQAEESLRESSRHLNEIIEQLPDATFVIDADRTVVAWNRAIERMTGVPKEEMIGKGNYEYAIPFYGERRPIIIDMAFLPDEEFEKREYAAVQRSADTIYGEVYVPKTYGGKGAYLSATASRLHDNEGNVRGAIESIRDITERKRAEEKRKSLEEHLQRAEKMESLGILAGGVAHDLNNVLGIVVGYAEMLLMDADESSPIRPDLVNIMKGGQRAAAIVQDMLTLTRRGVAGRRVLNLNRLIADSQLSPEFKNLSFHHPTIKIKIDLEPHLLNISGSSVHLDKTIFNLVSNASEAMPNGGTVTIKTTNQYLDRPIHGYDEVKEGEYVVLSVTDTGEGIPASDLKRIFEPFYTKKVMGRSGTGLGLAVVWGTVKDHHGYINVESEEGKGSAFILYFPVTREDISSEAVAVAISEYMGRGESILVVDDVKEQRDLAAGMLRKLNYKVTSVSGGEEAVAYLKEHKIDLIVLDMIMDPGMDGLDTYRSILEIHPKQRAIIVSGFSESDRVKAVKGLGAGAYVRKPYVIEKLGLAAREELERK